MSLPTERAPKRAHSLVCFVRARKKRSDAAKTKSRQAHLHLLHHSIHVHAAATSLRQPLRLLLLGRSNPPRRHRYTEPRRRRAERVRACGRLLLRRADRAQRVHVAKRVHHAHCIRCRFWLRRRRGGGVRGGRRGHKGIVPPVVVAAGRESGWRRAPVVVAPVVVAAACCSDRLRRGGHQQATAHRRRCRRRAWSR